MQGYGALAARDIGAAKHAGDQPVRAAGANRPAGAGLASYGRERGQRQQGAQEGDGEEEHRAGHLLCDMRDVRDAGGVGPDYMIDAGERSNGRDLHVNSVTTRGRGGATARDGQPHSGSVPVAGEPRPRSTSVNPDEADRQPRVTALISPAPPRPWLTPFHPEAPPSLPPSGHPLHLPPTALPLLRASSCPKNQTIRRVRPPGAPFCFPLCGVAAGRSLIR